jgi:hypothetical protein
MRLKAKAVMEVFVSMIQEDSRVVLFEVDPTTRGLSIWSG